MKKILKRIQNKNSDVETTITERFIAGAVAGFVSQTTVYPLDVINHSVRFLINGFFSFVKCRFSKYVCVYGEPVNILIGQKLSKRSTKSKAQKPSGVDMCSIKLVLSLTLDLIWHATKYVQQRKFFQNTFASI